MESYLIILQKLKVVSLSVQSDVCKIMKKGDGISIMIKDNM